MTSSSSGNDRSRLVEDGQVFYVLRDLAGNVRFKEWLGPNDSEHAALSRIAESCRKRGETNWRDLNLRGLNFENIDLSMLDFSGSDLSGSDLRHTNLTAANLSNCKLVRTSFVGAYSKSQTLFCGAECHRANFSGSLFVAPNFRGAKITKSSMCDMRWRSPVMTYSSQLEVNYDRSELLNGDWGRSVVSKCSLKGTNLSDSLSRDVNYRIDPTKKTLSSRSFPNKMRLATFVGNETDDETVLNDMNKWDMFIDKRINMCSSLLTTASLIGLAIGFDTLITEHLVNYVGPQLKEWAQYSPVVVIGFYELFKSKVFEPLVTSLLTGINNGFINLRSQNSKHSYGFQNRVNLVALRGAQGQTRPILKGLEAVRRKKAGNPLYEMFRYMTVGKESMVICDKRHLAEAVAHISSNRKRGYRLSQSITLIQANPESLDGTPSTVTFNTDGTTTMTWVRGGKTNLLVDYDEEGRPICQRDVQNDMEIPLEKMIMPEVGDLYSALDRFERKILEQNGLGHFDYDREESYVVAGEDGTLMVHRKEDRELHNSKGPSIIVLGKERGTQDWLQEYYFTHGELSKKEDVMTVSSGPEKRFLSSFEKMIRECRDFNITANTEISRKSRDFMEKVPYISMSL